MKKVILVFLVALVLASCATVNYAPVNGAFYTEIKGPFGVTANRAAPKSEKQNAPPTWACGRLAIAAWKRR